MARLTAPGIMVAVAACGTAGSPPHALRVGPGLAAMLAVADESRAPWRCSGSRELAPDATIGEWALRGGTVRRPATELKPLTIGIVADAAGPDPKTIAALSRLRTSFERANVDLVVSLGGMGATRAEISATLNAVAGSWLIIALPGDLEAMSAHVGAIAELQARGAAVIDGRSIRSIETRDAMLAVIPGVGSAYRSLAGSDSCVWTPSDVAETHRELSAFPGLRIAVNAEAPRTVIDGEATGEVALVPQVPVDIVVHGPTHAAPTPDTRGGRDSTKIGLSPGSADATTRLPPSRGPAAGLLAIRERTWEWRGMIDPPPHSQGSAAHPGDPGKSLTTSRTDDPRVGVRDDPGKSLTRDDARVPMASASRGTRNEAGAIEGDQRNFAAR